MVISTIHNLWNIFSSYCKRSTFLWVLLVSKEGKVVIALWPNWQLWTALFLYIGKTLTHGSVSMTAGYAETLVLLYWSVTEIGWGANLFRRLLGGLVFVIEVWYLIR